jgi:amino acid permease
MSETRFAAITTAIIIMSYAVAMTVSSLEKVLAYVGSTGSTSISFILPGLFYYKISDPEGIEHQKLMKEDDDESDVDDAEDGEEMVASGFIGEGIMRGSGLLDRVVGGIEGRKKLLRRLSLALAVYGVVVMVVCLITNTFFVIAH